MMRILVVLLLLGPVLIEGYKMLAIFSLPSRSHNHLGQGIVHALLKAGHEVTWVSAFPPKGIPAKGLTIIDASALQAITDKFDLINMQSSDIGVSFIHEFTTNISRATLEIPALKEVLVKEQFDAVLTESFFCDLDSGYAAIQQIPWIVLSGIVLQPTVEAMIDDVKSLATVPMMLFDYPIPMNFFQRVSNVGLHVAMQLYNWWYSSEVDTLYRDLFGPLAAARGLPLPPLSEVKHNVSILFVNSHSSFAPAQSVPPNVIDIGGYHIEETQTPLPKDLQDIIESSPKGVVYFSLGSVLKSASLPPQTKKDLLKTLGELPYTVLWKFEEMLEDLPKNVHIRPWMPQASILAHNNTRLFITHGGLLSSLEALRYGVPLVAIPAFGDQPANAARAVRAGYAQKVEFDTGTMADGLKVALHEVLSTDKYFKRAKYLSSLFNNRPVAPSKLISHYVEVAIESKGAYHLRSKSKEYSWYQRWLLDMFAAFAFIILIVAIILRKSMSFVVGKLTGSKSVKSKTH